MKFLTGPITYQDHGLPELSTVEHSQHPVASPYSNWDHIHLLELAMPKTSEIMKPSRSCVANPSRAHHLARGENDTPCFPVLRFDGAASHNTALYKVHVQPVQELRNLSPEPQASLNPCVQDLLNPNGSSEVFVSDFDLESLELSHLLRPGGENPEKTGRVLRFRNP